MQVRKLSYPDTLLVDNPRDVPGPGYTAYSLGTGTAMLMAYRGLRGCKHGQAERSCAAGLGYWTQAQDMLHSRSDHGVVASGKYIYLIGGLSDEGINKSALVLDSMTRYDTQTGRAPGSRVAGLRRARSWACCTRGCGPPGQIR